MVVDMVVVVVTGMVVNVDWSMSRVDYESIVANCKAYCIGITLNHGMADKIECHNDYVDMVPYGMHTLLKHCVAIAYVVCCLHFVHADCYLMEMS